MPGPPSASIVIPTRARPDYLAQTLASVAPQASGAGAEVLVVSDGLDPGAEALAARQGARFVALPEPRGLNAARNRGVAEARGDLIAFIDDDVHAPEGWLTALLTAASASPNRDVFGGPIRARIEGGGPRSCGRETAPITTLDFGPVDHDVGLVWGANMAVRRGVFEHVGPFDESLKGRGDEEEWERRYKERGGRVRYVAGAGLEHRRAAQDATVPALARAGYQLGRSARRNDRVEGRAPALARELRTVAGCAWHIVRRRCAVGVVMLAEALGRLREALAEPR